MLSAGGEGAAAAVANVQSYLQLYQEEPQTSGYAMMVHGRG